MDEMITWECPNCTEENDDPEGSETHCSKCGLVVLVYDECVINQGWSIVIENGKSRIVEGAV